MVVRRGTQFFSKPVTGLLQVSLLSYLALCIWNIFQYLMCSLSIISPILAIPRYNFVVSLNILNICYLLIINIRFDCLQYVIYLVFLSSKQQNFNSMSNLNKTTQKAQRICTTPQRMRLVQSIKKSIHRSIEKINPNDYKNILKGQCIFMHLCYGGELINSEYTKVALFMGASVFKKAIQKVTVVVTNESSNKSVKKLAAMGKPVLSVLWLQACFQQKRKVQYEAFLFQQQGGERGTEDEKQQQVSVNLDNLLNIQKQHVATYADEFLKNNNLNFLRFVDKKEKTTNKKYMVIPIHQIQIKVSQSQKHRKSTVITDKQPKKKNVNKKVEFKSEGADKLINYRSKLIDSKLQIKNNEEIQNMKFEDNTSKSEGSKKQQEKNRLSKKIYQKYLKDFKNYEAKIRQVQKPVEQPFKIDDKQTPSFINLPLQENYPFDSNFHIEANQTPPHNLYGGDRDSLQQTRSMKKPRQSIYRLSIIHPMISQKIEKINSARQTKFLPLIQIVGSDIRNSIWVISHQSKIQAILALLSHPKIIVNEGFIKQMEDNPCAEISDSLLHKHEIKCQLNSKNIEGKKIILLDSVMGSSSLERIIKQCKAEVVSICEYLLGVVKVDITITNKKQQYMKNPKDIVMCEADFINSLIIMEKPRQKN